MIWGFPNSSVGEEVFCSAGDPGDMSLIPGLGRPPGGGHGYPLYHSCLKNPTDGELGGLHSRGFQRASYD